MNPEKLNKDNMAAAIGKSPLDIQVVGKRVILYPIDIHPIVVKGGIALLGKKKEDDYEEFIDHPFQGVVVALGSELSDTNLKLGDHIYYRSKANFHIMHKQELYHVLDISEVVCIVSSIVFV